MFAARTYNREGGEHHGTRTSFAIDPQGAWQPCDWQSISHLHVPNSIRVLYRVQCVEMDRLIDQHGVTSDEQLCSFLRNEIALQYAWCVTRDLLTHQHRHADAVTGSAEGMSLEQLLDRVARRCIEESLGCRDYTELASSPLFRDAIATTRVRLPEAGALLDALFQRDSMVCTG